MAVGNALDIIKARIDEKEKNFAIIDNYGAELMANNPKITVNSPEVVKLGIIRKEIEKELFTYRELISLYHELGGQLTEDQMIHMQEALVFVEIKNGELTFKNLDTLNELIGEKTRMVNEQKEAAQPKKIFTLNEIRSGK